jgi:pimeloyl-ACP methyl ester carboxylesterase
MSTAAIGGRELYYTRTGSGPPVLLIQGLGGHGAHWGEEFPALLAERLEVIALDHVGTGRSGRLEGGLTIASMADDAAALLAELGIERAHVIGLSMGGMVAQELALARPELVDRLVLIGTSPSAQRGVRTPPEVMEALGEAWSSGDRERALWVGLEVNVSPAAAADPGIRALWREIAADRPVALQVLAAQLDAVREFDALDRLAALAAPTLVIHGTVDRMLPFDNARLLLDAIPDARLEPFDGAGHLPFLERPGRAAELVIRFLLEP